MSTITTTLTAVTEPIKATTVDASSPTSISAYVASQEAHDADISNTFVPQLNLIIGQTNTVIGELNTLASGVSTNAGIATTKAQLSSDYAEKMALEVETGTYSSKEHAIGDLTTSGGSAKAWATDTASPDGTTSKSAKTLASEAVVSASAAATSATNAHNSEMAAAALLDSFDDRYLGSKAIAPTLDNDGNALLSGAIYWNTALSQMYVYNLSTTTWIALSFIPTDHNSLTNIGTRTHAQLESDIAAKVGANLTVALNTARATVISHATTADIWAALGNQINFTGTATVTAFPNAPQAGAERTLICAGACSFTAGANMLIDGVTSGTTVTCVAGDTVIVRAISTTQFKLTRLKADGTAQVASGGAADSNMVSVAINTTMVKDTHYVVIAGAKILTLPITPTVGDKCIISTLDFYNTTIARNGSNIMGLAENMVIDTNNTTVEMQYIDTTNGWRIV